MAGLITPATGIINLRQFKESFTETLAEQDAADPYENSAPFSDDTLRQDLAKRCSIDDELKYSSQFFLDPTLFSLLRQYRDKNFDEIAHQTKQQAAEASAQVPYIPQRKRQARDVPASLVVDNPSPTGEGVEASLPPLPSPSPQQPETTSSNHKRRKTVAQSRLPAILNHIVPRDNDKESETADKGKGREKGKRKASASASSSVGMSSAGASSAGASSSAGGSVTSNVPTTPTLELPFALALPPTSAITTSLEVQTPSREHDEVRSGDGEDQNANEQEEGQERREEEGEESEESEEREVVATSLEKKYRDMAALLDQSCLATLK
ncbi:hypothetical protein BC937DRAFT_90384 [Endogone sp. FLAS-F59071]|nr:hypothetical protein BC937DRAFT_90384 [Endogone sp. FLAS-F59071]|eukprot:RUS17134.1 hypothetical protein BC937DRAFT_90384 [Endogone sp. FLAS-F59071]